MPVIIVNGIVQTISVPVHNLHENGTESPVFVKQGIGEIIVRIVREQMPRGIIRIKNVSVPVGHGVLHRKNV